MESQTRAVKISVATLTYARPELLCEAIESFLRQTYKDCEMVVLNTYIKQHLVFEHPRVRVINSYYRPETIGDARNICIKMCSGEMILNLDDDDIILPGYLEWLVNHLEGRTWVRQTKRFTIRKGVMEGMRDEQATNQTLFRKDAWEKVGGYPGINSSEDKRFNSKIHKLSAGGRVKTEPKDVGFCYRIGSGRFNVSFFGHDRPGGLTGTQNTDRMLAKSPQRSGRIVLSPFWKNDYEAMTRKWLVKNGYKV